MSSTHLLVARQEAPAIASGSTSQGFEDRCTREAGAGMAKRQLNSMAKGAAV